MTLTCQRHLFSLPDDVRYLNCAYMAPLTRRVELAGIDGIRRKNDPSTIMPSDFFDGPAQIRAQFAELIGCDTPNRIAIVPSVSYGLGAVARNLSLSRGQNIVMAQHQFPANTYPWRRIAADRGVELRVVDAPAVWEHRGRIWNERLLDAIDGDTGLVAMGIVHWTDGTRFDLESLGRRARDVDAAFVLDGTQSIGAVPFGIGDVKPDAVICAAYKWLTGPYSIGAGYFGPRFDDGEPLEESWSARVGSENFGGLVDYQDEYRPGAVRYDVGEMSNFVLTPMFNAALRQVSEWTPGAIAEYTGRLTAALAGQVGDRLWVEDAEWRAPHMLGIGFPADRSVAAVQRRLAEDKISVSARGRFVRVAPHVYNDDEDIAVLAEALLR